MNGSRWLMILGAVVAVLVIIQIINIGVSDNPPVEQDLAAPPEVSQLLHRACYDCHSNETVWPWYSRVAPSKWLVGHDVAEGRGELNFSTWNRYEPRRMARKVKEIADQVERGEMPPRLYTPMHPAARLTVEERQQIVAWARAYAQEIADANGIDLNAPRPGPGEAGGRGGEGGAGGATGGGH